MRTSYSNFNPSRTVFRPILTNNHSTEITFLRTSPINMRGIPNNFYNDNYNDPRFSINRPRWEEEEPYTPPRNPHQTQNLSQYELTGIPEPNFSNVPWRPDRTTEQIDEFQFDQELEDYINEEIDLFMAHPPPQPPRHFPHRRPTRRSSRSTTRSISSDIYNMPSTSSIRGVVNARTLRPSYPLTSSTQTQPRVRTLRVSVSTTPTTTPPKKKEEKPKPKITLKTQTITQKEVGDELTCSICLEPFKKDEKVTALKCKHLYHKDCIKPWIESHYTCPICRSDITDDPKTTKKS